MRAVGITRFGGPEVLEMSELPVSPRAPGGGAQAELVVVTADPVARVPDGVSFTAAATLP
jgi:NADPH:quinone reductase-like Zn-dependent oxidoreductase